MREKVYDSINPEKYTIDAQKFWLERIVLVACSLNNKASTKALGIVTNASSVFLENLEERKINIDQMINDIDFLKGKTSDELTPYIHAMEYFEAKVIENKATDESAMKSHSFFSLMKSKLKYLKEDQKTQENEIIKNLQTHLESEKTSCSKPLGEKIDELLTVLNDPEESPSKKISHFKEMVEENRPSLGARILNVILCILNGRRISDVLDENPFKSLKCSFWNRTTDLIQEQEEEKELDLPSLQ